MFTQNFKFLTCSSLFILNAGCFNNNTNMFIYIKNFYAFLLKLSATTKQLIRRSSACYLKNLVIFFRVVIEIGLTPPPYLFHLLFKDAPLHNKPFIKKGSLEEMEGVNDNARAFMYLNVKANK